MPAPTSPRPNTKLQKKPMMTSLARELRGNAAKAHVHYLDLLERAEAWMRTALAFSRAADAFFDVSKTYQRHLREAASKDV